MHDPDTEVIKGQMEQTRSALTEKIETLEEQIVGTVHEATSAVTDTVETVKEAVGSTAEAVQTTVVSVQTSVRDALNLPLQTQRHPWMMMCGAMTIGFICGRLVDPGTAPRHRRVRHATSRASPVAMQEPRRARSRRPSSLKRVFAALAPHMERLKGVAVGMALDSLNQSIRHNVPEQWREPIVDAIESVAREIGATPEQTGEPSGKWSERWESGDRQLSNGARGSDSSRNPK